jgi:hypothetical protein
MEGVQAVRLIDETPVGMSIYATTNEETDAGASLLASLLLALCMAAFAAL